MFLLKQTNRITMPSSLSVYDKVQDTHRHSTTSQDVNSNSLSTAEFSFTVVFCDTCDLTVCTFGRIRLTEMHEFLLLSVWVDLG